jgi:hypothetical protein
MLVIVDMRLAGVMLILFLAAVVMAVGERTMIVLVRVPRRLVFPLAQRNVAMVMGDVVVVMRVGDRGMGVRACFAFPFHLLRRFSLSTGRIGGLCWCSFCWLHALVSLLPARQASSSPNLRGRHRTALDDGAPAQDRRHKEKHRLTMHSCSA